MMADILGTEAAMVRVSISSAAHAMACALWASVTPGSKILVATGMPDEASAGVFAELAEWGVRSVAVPLCADGSIDASAIAAATRDTQPDAVLLQRGPRLFAQHASAGPVSCHHEGCLTEWSADQEGAHEPVCKASGHKPRASPDEARVQHSERSAKGLTGHKDGDVQEAQRCGAAQPRQLVKSDDVALAIRAVRAEAGPGCTVVVDNVGAELLDDVAMGALGADAVTGSLLGHLGGGLAPEGGYVAGEHGLLGRACARLSAPGLSLDAGSVPGATQRKLFQGVALSMPLATSLARAAATGDLCEVLKQQQPVGSSASAAHAGLFLAPSLLCEAQKGAAYLRRAFAELGVAVHAAPQPSAPLTRITLPCLHAAEALLRSVQAHACTDASAPPRHDVLDGRKVLVAGSGFVRHSTTEARAVACAHAPFEVVLTGGQHWTVWVTILDAARPELVQYS